VLNKKRSRGSVANGFVENQRWGWRFFSKDPEDIQSPQVDLQPGSVPCFFADLDARFEYPEAGGLCFKQGNFFQKFFGPLFHILTAIKVTFFSFSVLFFAHAYPV